VRAEAVEAKQDPTTKQARHVLPESICLVLIGGLDLVYTVYLLAVHRAIEANPLFSKTLHEYGIEGFIGLKALLLAVPLSVAELARGSHPLFVRRALRVCIALYLFIYLYGFVQVNLLR
jgi:uncharacterized membrane protein